MKHHYLISLAFAVLVLATGFVYGGPYEDGVAAYARQDYQTAQRIWTPLAESGDTRAQIKLANIYANAAGVPQSREQAHYWMKMAAEGGNAEAQYTLGNWYRYFSPSRQPEYQESLYWLLKAGDQHHAEAEYRLGEAYSVGGYGAPNSDADAFKWFLRAAEDGHGRAAHELGFWYRVGRYISQDDVLSYHWYRESAKHGELNSLSDLAQAYMTGKGIARNSLRAHMWLNLAIAYEGSISSDIPIMAAMIQMSLADLDAKRLTLEMGMTKAEIIDAQQMAATCQASHYVSCE